MRRASILLGFFLLVLAPGALRAEDALVGGTVTFYQHVEPIFRKSCTGCHGGESPKGKLSLESFEGLQAGGKKGVAVVPGKAGESLLYLLASGQEKPKMPPKDAEPLTAPEVELVRLWIEGGARPGERVSEPTPYSRVLSPPTYGRPPVVTALAYSADGTRLFVAGYHEILVHDADSPVGSTPAARFVGEAERLNVLVLDPGGRLLAAAGGSPARFGELQLWNAAEGKLERFVRMGSDTLFAAAFSPDGARLAVGGPDRSIHVIETATGKEVYASEVHSDWIFGIAFTADGSRIVSGGRDKTLKASDAADGKFLSTLETFNESVLSIAGRPGTRFVLAAGEGRTPVLFDAVEGKEVRKYEGHPGAILATAFSKDGKLLAVAGVAGEVRVHEAENGSRKATLGGGKEWTYALAFRPDGARLAAAGYDGIVRVYGLPEGKEIVSFVPVPVSAGGARAPAETNR